MRSEKDIVLEVSVQELLSVKGITSRLQFISNALDIGIMTDNQVLIMFGYTPFEGGDIFYQSIIL